MRDILPVFAGRANGLGLMRREDRELDAVICQYLKRGEVNCCFGKPHSFRLAAESVPEIGNAPSDLYQLEALRRERHDCVYVEYPLQGFVCTLRFDAVRATTTV